MSASRPPHQPQPVGVDFKVLGMLLHPANAEVEIGEHLRGAEFCDRAWPDGEDGVSLAAQDIERLRSGMIADLAAIGVPCPANNIHNCQAIALGIRCEYIH